MCSKGLWRCSRSRRAPGWPGRPPRTPVGWRGSSPSRPCQTPACGGCGRDTRRSCRRGGAPSRIGLHLDERPLDGLVHHSGLPNTTRSLAYLTDTFDAELRRADALGGLSDPVLVQESWPTSRPVPSPPEDGSRPAPGRFEGELAVVGGHVERPPHERDVEPRAVARHHEAVMPVPALASPDVRAKTMSWEARARRYSSAWCR